MTITNPRRRMAIAAGVTLSTIGLATGGFSGSASAIIDGADTSVADNPWQVALTSPDGEQFCGGSLVSERVVVTAAHCTQGTPGDEIAIRAGTTDLDSDDGQTREVTRVIEHPKYVEGVGDIAMLVIDSPFDSSPNIAAIPIATADQVATATTARVTGWGVTDAQGEDSPSVLQSTDVPLIADADCSLVEAGNDDELCAGGQGPDSCFGDSGGPLTIATDGGRALAGVVSWGEECGDDNGGVYAEVPTFATWIAERIADPDAPAGDRLPAPEQPADVEDGDFEDGEIIEIEQEFIDELGDDIDSLSDEEFWERYEEFLESDSSDGDTDGDDVDSEHACELGETDLSETDLSDIDISDVDLNGDGLVQWEELLAL